MQQELKLLIGLGLATVLLIGGAVFFLSKSAPATPSGPADPKLLVRDDSPKSATSSAKITLVEFGDFQCPACAAAEPVIKQILKTYPDKINLVFRNFPLPIHQNATMAANAAMAANAQGKFWPYHDKLYETQSEWSELQNPLEIFVKYASELGLEANKFRADVSANKFADQIAKDQADGYALGVNSTPTFYINGVKQEGVPSFSDLKSKIDAAL